MLCDRYHWDLFLLSIDEGISGYRDDSLETVKRNELQVSTVPHARPTLAFKQPQIVPIFAT